MPVRTLINIKHIKHSAYFLPKCDDGIHSIQKSNSWFDLEHIDYGTQNIILDKDIVITKDNFTKSEQIKLIPNKFQKYLLLKWFEAARQVYNLTIYYFKNNKFTSFISVRSIIQNLFNTQLKNFIKRYSVPVHVINNAINDVCDSYKINLNKLKKKQITHFRMRYQKYTKEKQTIVLEKEDFNKKINCFYRNSFEINNLSTIYLKDKIRTEDKKYKAMKLKDNYIKFNNKCNQIILNKISKNKKYYTDLITSKSILGKDITCNVRLTFNKLKDTFILNVPKKYNRDEVIKKKRTCSIDPGYKTFLNIYDPTGSTYKIYNRDKVKTNIKTLSVQKKDIEEYIKNKKYKQCKELKLKTYKQGKEIKYYDKSLKVITKYYKKLKQKLENKIKDLHYKSANFLCQTYTDIYLGKLSTKAISSKEGKLNRSEKLYGYSISHDKFRTILENKSKEYGTKINIVCEGHTSRTCGSCGKNKKIGGERIYNCKCGVKLDRDLNAARNILIKHNPLLM